MTDEQLKTYLPSYGDRLAVLGYCRRKENDPKNRRTKLFDRLKAKLSKRQRDDPAEDNRSQQAVKPKNAEKGARKVELGWMEFSPEKECFMQVRARRGGGTRKVDVAKEWTKKELTQQAVDLFFPDGKNVHGNITDFEVDLTDYQERSMDVETTVGKLYEDTKLPIMRFYLTTKKKHDIAEEIQQKSNAVVPLERQESTDGHASSSSFPNLPTDLSSESTDTPEVIFVGAIDVDILDDSNIVTFLTENLTAMEEHDLDDTLPLFTEHVTEKRTIVVHRGQVLPELITHFCDESLLRAEVHIQLVLPDGKQEMGQDEGGVLRDCLSEFWHEFYDQCTLGNAFKVPFLRHDFGKQQWKSIGRIIAFGWQREKYLPVKLAPVIMEQAVFGGVKSDLLENFLKYIPESESLTLESCRSNFNSVDQEELLEILEVHSCRKMPTANNFEEILQELAHKRLIQEPAYVIEQWTSILTPVRKELEDIVIVYQNLQPTGRKIMKALAFPSTMNVQEKDIQQYVTTYLRESDAQRLSRFLRFCTGSDLFIGKTITIDFTNLQGFQRRPVAHTCGCFLELSIHYDSYPDFRSEMNKILESNVWVMDIV